MATRKQKTAGRVGRKSGFDFEEVIRKKYNGTNPTKALDCFGERLTIPKTDIIIQNQNWSIKNPKSTGTSTQIQVCSVERFCKKLKPPKDVKLALEMFAGGNELLMTKETFKRNVKYFKSFCINEWKIDPSKLSTKNELSRSRLLYKNIPNNSIMLKWLQDNIVEITRFVFATSFNQAPQTIAKMLGWSTIKNDINSIRTFDIEAIIAKVAKDNPTCIVRESQSVIKLGFFTLQMKGSGEDAAYHSLQFNCSYKDLSKFMGHGGGTI
jgi:hypothetical protein